MAQLPHGYRELNDRSHRDRNAGCAYTAVA